MSGFLAKQFARGAEIANRSAIGRLALKHPVKVGLGSTAAALYGVPRAWDAALDAGGGSPAVDAATETLRRIWAPALAAAVVSGGASGLLSSRVRNPGESKEERRRRILSNALVGGAAGGTAVAAIPVGNALLSTPATLRDKYGSSRLADLVASGALNIGKFGLGAAGGIAAVRYGIPGLKGFSGLAARNKAVREAANRHVTAFGRKLSGEGTLETAASRLLKDPGTLLPDDIQILKAFERDVPSIARRMATGGRISSKDINLLNSLRDKALTDDALMVLKNRYGIENVPRLTGDLVDGLEIQVRRAGRMDPEELGRTGHFFDFIDPRINQNTRRAAGSEHPFRTVVNPADENVLISTLPAAQQLGLYGGFGLGGHTLYHSLVPST